ncbi:similarity to CDC20 (WD-repeat protein) [Encephalitozoon cuniculi GB-M1]|uniref:Similarity to CDC20 (WD-repeat protein) n=2 Tax=Encephalitozoon cuniculi TaxID=6035 RepID=Q8SVZ6_ENCCU|nr:WD40 domain-containing protein [Encephalitozoon cuniculi GB-M1]AGE96404.1 wd-repeat protein [Encephalitozoon cuniculi]KMV66516.1 WD40 domain-containing protein [Encephalitozoon cuniculi EcunIII-L]UYI28144.1 WD40 domain-containing protein [Encephalitozoon cuniculi]CAD26295.1 similarity to CDC20 (WD-repeat protein) [Encephalitozoon cuniculi GB-M1]
MDRFLVNKKEAMPGYASRSVYGLGIREEVHEVGFGYPLGENPYLSTVEGRNLGPKIIIQPYRQLKTKSLPDDFYSSLIDWSGENVFFTADGGLFVHNFFSSKTLQICSLNSFGVTSVKCNPTTGSIALGTSVGVMLSLDIGSLKMARYPFHKSRIGVIESESTNVITGSRDRKIKITDLRSEKAVATILHHRQEVCGLSISKDLRFLASGGNDNRLYIYDYRNLSHPLKQCSNHKAAVKAMSWSPLSPNLLISGGGTADKTVKLWDVNMINSSRSSSCLVRSVDYGSQICNLKWLKSNKILSTHGYSKDDIRLSQMSSFKIERYFLGHKNRVIHFSCSDDEKYFVSGSSDSNINFWELDGERDDEIKIR